MFEIPHCFSQPDIVGALLLGTSTPGWGGWCGAGVSCFSGGNLPGQDTLVVLNCHREGWGQPILHLHLSSQTGRGFFISLAIKLTFSQTSDSRLTVLHFSCNLNVFTEGSKHSVYNIYSTILDLLCPRSSLMLFLKTTCLFFSGISGSRWDHPIADLRWYGDLGPPLGEYSLSSHPSERRKERLS